MNFSHGGLMSSNNSQQYAIDRFWHNYSDILDKNRVHKSTRTWYRKHVEMYTQANLNDGLMKHTPTHVDQYLNAKGRITDIEEWQFRQIVDALKFLFYDLLKTAWAKKYDWH